MNPVSHLCMNDIGKHKQMAFSNMFGKDTLNSVPLKYIHSGPLVTIQYRFKYQMDNISEYHFVTKDIPYIIIHLFGIKYSVAYIISQMFCLYYKLDVLQ